MTAPHGHSPGGGSAGRAILLVAVAIALGAFLLARGFDGADDPTAAAGNGAGRTETGTDPDDGENGNDPETVVSTTTTTTTTTTQPPIVTRPPGEVKVAVANGTGDRGRAGRTAGTLNASGYVTAAKNTEQDRVGESVIYYRPGYGDDAKAVASALGAPADLLTPAPATIMTLIRNPPQDLETFNIFVVVGTDNVILDPDPVAG